MECELGGAKLVGSPRKDIPELYKDSLDSLFVASYFIDNLSPEDISKLKLRKQGIRELVILDYFLERDINKNEIEMFATETSSRKYLLDLISQHDFTDDSKEKKNISISQTPEKQITYLAYLSFLKNEKSKELVKKSKSKTDLKRVYCFDYIYPMVSKDRQEKLDLEGNVPEIVSKVVRSYKNQIKIQEVSKKINNLELMLQELSTTEISAGIVEVFQRFKENAYEDITEITEDEDLKGEFEEVKVMLKRGECLIAEKIQIRTEEDLEKLKQKLEYLTEKKYILEEDETILEQTLKRSDGLENLLNYAKTELPEGLKNIVRELRELAGANDYFKRNKKYLDSHKKQLVQELEEVSRLGVKNPDLKPNYTSIDRIIELYSREKEYEKTLEIHEKNRYCANYLTDTKEKQKELYREIHEKTLEANISLECSMELEKQNQEKYKKGFWGMFFRKGIEKRIKELERYQTMIGTIEESLR